MIASLAGWFAYQGRSLLIIAITVILFAAPAALGFWVHRLFGSLARAWAAGIALFILLGAALWPTAELLTHVNCRYDRQSGDDCADRQ